MIFQEKKLESGYEYKVEDVFGEIVFTSDIKLDGDKLDGMVSLLLGQSGNAETVTGTVRHDLGSVEYTFTKASLWGDVTPEEEREWEDPSELCENTPISIKQPESVFTRIKSWIILILKRLRRSVEVLREVWRNPQ